MTRKSEFVPTEAGQHLSGRPTKGTRPEVAVRRALHQAGFRFRLHVKLGRACTPDILLPRHRVAVWVDGCFWHGHEHVQPVTRGPNAKLWQEKIESNRVRDQAAVRTAEALDYSVVRVWECEVKNDLSAVVARVRRASRTNN